MRKNFIRNSKISLSNFGIKIQKNAVIHYDIKDYNLKSGLEIYFFYCYKFPKLRGYYWIKFQSDSFLVILKIHFF